MASSRDESSGIYGLKRLPKLPTFIKALDEILTGRYLGIQRPSSWESLALEERRGNGDPL